MKNLFTLQENMQEYLMNKESEIYQSIIATQKLPVERRLGIYGEAYCNRLIEALESNFPGIKRSLGDELFQQTGMTYIKMHPSKFRSIRWFGDEFASYLAPIYPALAELADFEWKLTLSFDSQDVDTFKIDQISAIAPESWPDMVMIAHPSLQRMNYFWNTVDLWQAIIDEEVLPNSTKKLTATPWVMWRKDYLSRFKTVSEIESWAIDCMMSKHSFGELCEGLCSLVDEQEAPLQAATLLKNWILSGFLSDIQI